MDVPVSKIIKNLLIVEFRASLFIRQDSTLPVYCFCEKFCPPRLLGTPLVLGTKE
jgi:hypothetical protein